MPPRHLTCSASMTPRTHVHSPRMSGLACSSARGTYCSSSVPATPQSSFPPVHSRCPCATPPELVKVTALLTSCSTMPRRADPVALALLCWKQSHPILHVPRRSVPMRVLPSCRVVPFVSPSGCSRTWHRPSLLVERSILAPITSRQTRSLGPVMFRPCHQSDSSLPIVIATSEFTTHARLIPFLSIVLNDFFEVVPLIHSCSVCFCASYIGHQPSVVAAAPPLSVTLPLTGVAT